MESFDNKVALVTGGGGDIGRELCLGLARAGGQIVAADLSGERAAATAALCREIDACPAAIGCQVDVTSRESLQSMLDDVHVKLGAVQLLCANAGVSPPLGTVTERPDSDWEFAFSVNVMGVIRTVDACVADLRAKAPDAHVMITASMGGILVRGHMPLGTYSPSKFACVGYAEELKHQLSGEDIGVSVLLPGLIDTNMAVHSAEARPRALGEQQQPARKGLSPRLKEIAITAEQAADVALAGIRGSRFYISTHSDAVDRLRPHFERMLAEIEEQGVEPGIQQRD